MTVSGAYGRDYKSGKAMKADWDAGKDFVIRDLFSGPGTYVSKRDNPPESVMGRFNQDRGICILKK